MTINKIIFMEEIISNIFRLRMPQLGPPEWEVSNVYFIGTDEIILIDAGYPTADSVNSILGTWKKFGKPKIAAILVTHAHPDHIGAIAEIKRATNAPIWSHPLEEEHIKEMLPLVKVDKYIFEGDEVRVPGAALKIFHMPGHTDGHLCFFEENSASLFTGDLVINNSFAIIAPPRGIMRNYMESLDRMLNMSIKTIMPGHGTPIIDPKAKIKEYILHRQLREIQILKQLQEGPKSIPEMAEDIYSGMHPMQKQAGQMQILAHIIKMEDERQIMAISGIGLEAIYKNTLDDLPF